MNTEWLNKGQDGEMGRIQKTDSDGSRDRCCWVFVEAPPIPIWGVRVELLQTVVENVEVGLLG